MDQLTDIELAGKASAKLMNAEKKLADLDRLYAEGVRRLDALADGTNDASSQALRLRAHQERIGGYLRLIKAEHALLSVLQCEIASVGVPMVRGGER